MRIIRTFFFLAISATLWNCQPETSTTNKEETPNVVAAVPEVGALPAPTSDKEGADDLQKSVAVGEIKEACQLISEAWVSKNIPGFQSGTMKLISRTSPDGNASACQCIETSEGSKTVFVVGYRIAAGNVPYLQSLLTDGLKRENARNIPPYDEVRGLGQIAAFSKYNGNLVWVTESGLYLYMYMYPQGQELMKQHFNVLYEVAPQISAVVAKYGAKS